MNHLKLYKIDINYLKYLYSFDNRVQFNPNNDEDYSTRRPYIGIVYKKCEFNYFVPLEHPRLSHQKLRDNIFILKIHNGKYGILGFNNMIPVNNNELIKIDINKENKKYKEILINQLNFCNKHIKEIRKRAEITYESRSKNIFMKKVCCNFKILEEKSLLYNI